MKESPKKHILIIGCGAAGFFAAIGAATGAAIGAAAPGAAVTILERNAMPGRKLRITGKGRCNITNDCGVDEFLRNVPRNPKFLYSALSKFTPADTVAFFESIGVAVKTERGRRVFPVSDSAGDVANALEGYVRSLGCAIIRSRAAELIIEGGRAAGVRGDGCEFRADSVIICTGGLSYPQTGSTGDGYRLAGQAGHEIIAPRPSLVPLEARRDHLRDCLEMTGLTLKNIAFAVYDDETGKAVCRDFGELLFTHFGISGPVVLSASSHLRGIKPGFCRAVIDLKPALDEAALDTRLRADFAKYINRDFANALGDLLPGKMIPVIVRRSGIDPAKKVNAVTKTERRALLELLKSFEIGISEFRPVEEAIITSGGVSTTQINPATMESRLLPGLYFAGEVIDTDAYTGGFNLQIAFSTGRLAGVNAVSG